MVIVPHMLLIGATERDAGKTTFACELLRRFNAPVIAVKITVIQERNGECPRGGQGCGVCTSLAGNYCITEETSKTGKKDTQRLLAAGADRVYWLRTLRSEAEEGALALLREIGSDAPVVCESNSIRHTLEPGLFILVTNKYSDKIKASAVSVRSYADLIVQSNGHAFEFDFNRIQYTGNRWTLSPEHAPVSVDAERN